MAMNVDMLVSYEDEEWRDVYVYISKDVNGEEWAFPVTLDKRFQTISDGSVLYAHNSISSFIDATEDPPAEIQERFNQVRPMAVIMARGDD